MKCLFSRAGWVRVAIFSGIVLWGSGVPANGQINSWTNSVSGNWEDSHWSLGVLPGSGQTILLTNAGFKAVAIGTNTVQNFPQALLVDSMTISSPTNSSNTLLLNYAGLKDPLMMNSLTVGNNSAVVVNASSLQISNTLMISGTFTEDVFSEVTNASLDVESGGAGGYHLNSGLLTSGFGEDIGFTLPSVFVQAGGTNHAVGVRVYTNSEYDMNGGLLDGVIILRLNATFKQQGGTVDNSTNDANFTSVDGNFLQSGGLFIGPTNAAMYLPGFSILHRTGISGVGVQTGGTNQQNNLILGFQVPATNQDNGNNVPGDSGTYTLSNGVLTTSGTIVAGNGSMEQAGGTHIINGTLAMQGGLYFFNNIINRTIRAAYALDGGVLTAQDISMGVASTFSQSGGLLIVSNDFQLADTAFQQTGGAISQFGVLTLADALWFSAAGNQQLGRLQLGGTSGGASSVLTMPVGACLLHFGNSSSLTWSSGAVLHIDDWSGSVNGGGSQQIIFGNGSGALTGQQLSQIVFQNPSGLAAGAYSARILSTGEIVPDTAVATLGIVNQPNGMLQINIQGRIGSNYIVQTSTDLVHWVSWKTQLNATGTISLSDGVTNGLVRFYRAALVP